MVPELPDIEAYLRALQPRLLGHPITAIRLGSPFLLRTTDPPIDAAVGRTVTSLRRVGKRIAIEADGIFVVLHSMVAGRLRWMPPRAPLPKRGGLAAIDSLPGTLIVTEAGTTRRASLHMAAGEAGLAALDPGGLEPLDADFETFLARLLLERHTLKRALTDATLFSGIGNAYSDEILHRARLSPMRLSDSLATEEQRALHAATQSTLTEWRDRLVSEAAEAFPAHVTAFREGMAVHGRYGRPCPTCRTPVQRIRYASNESNYCASCQTGGRLLADRGLSRLLKGDWPRTLDELERRKRNASSR